MIHPADFVSSTPASVTNPAGRGGLALTCSAIVARFRVLQRQVPRRARWCARSRWSLACAQTADAESPAREVLGHFWSQNFYGFSPRGRGLEVAGSPSETIPLDAHHIASDLPAGRRGSSNVGGIAPVVRLYAGPWRLCIQCSCLTHLVNAELSMTRPSHLSCRFPHLQDEYNIQVVGDQLVVGIVARI